MNYAVRITTLAAIAALTIGSSADARMWGRRSYGCSPCYEMICGDCQDCEGFQNCKECKECRAAETSSSSNDTGFGGPSGVVITRGNDIFWVDVAGGHTLYKLDEKSPSPHRWVRYSEEVQRSP